MYFGVRTTHLCLALTFLIILTSLFHIFVFALLSNKLLTMFLPVVIDMNGLEIIKESSFIIFHV